MKLKQLNEDTDYQALYDKLGWRKYNELLADMLSVVVVSSNIEFMDDDWENFWHEAEGKNKEDIIEYFANLHIDEELVDDQLGFLKSRSFALSIVNRTKAAQRKWAEEKVEDMFDGKKRVLKGGKKIYRD